MFLLQILKKRKLNSEISLIPFLKLKQYIENLINKILVLKQVKEKSQIKHLKSIIFKDYKYSKVKQDLIKYTITISLLKSNNVIIVTDIKGNLKFLLTSGLVGLTGKQKVKQPIALIKLLKTLIVKTNILANQPIALHFKNVTRYYKLFIVFMLKKKFFIKLIKDYSLQPHNGCRPKKIKRKQKGRKLVFKY